MRYIRSTMNWVREIEVVSDVFTSVGFDSELSEIRGHVVV